MKDKISKRKLKRFDYYRFLMDKNLYTRFCFYCDCKHLDKNSYKVRHDYICHLGFMSEIKENPLYDRKNVIKPGEFVEIEELCRISKTKWLPED